MIIANPIYDVVFKYIMQDERIARFFISTLLQKTITKVQLLPQEHIYTEELIGVRVFRFDFSAEIEDENGQRQNILIEIQKAYSNYDLQRFRNYLGENYKKNPQIIDGRKEILPIFSIYLMGFTINDLTRAVVRINRHYFDLLTETDFNERSEFVEKLTHDSIIVQIPRLNGKIQSRIYKVLSIFEQENFTDNQHQTKNYKETPDDSELNYLLKQLAKASADAELRKKMALEQEAYDVLENATKEIKEKLLIAEKQKEEAEKLLNKAELEKAILKLHTKGISIEEIAKSKGLSTSEILKILEE